MEISNRSPVGFSFQIIDIVSYHHQVDLDSEAGQLVS